jgi:hypothetical protein
VIGVLISIILDVNLFMGKWQMTAAVLQLYAGGGFWG